MKSKKMGLEQRNNIMQKTDFDKKMTKTSFLLS